MLALKQRQVRKRAFIQKHGIHAHIQHCFDAPIPSRVAEAQQDDDEDDDDDDLSFSAPPNSYDAPRICDM